MGSDLTTTLGRQGLELMRLEESRCCCVPSDPGSYFTPGIVDEGSLSGLVSPTYSVGAVGTPSGSRTLSVSSDGIPKPPSENAIVIRVPVSSRAVLPRSNFPYSLVVASTRSFLTGNWLSNPDACGGRGGNQEMAMSYC